MRLVLTTYFDLGFSLGLGDGALAAAGLAPRDQASSGLGNPLGNGHRLDLTHAPDSPLRLWQTLALERLAVDASRGGTEDDTAAIAQQAHDWLAAHPPAALEVVVYGVGVATLRLEGADGLPPGLLSAIEDAIEYAGYDPRVSDAVLAATRARIGKGERPGREGIEALTRRPEPQRLQPESDDEGEQSNLFTSFTSIALCLSRDDDVEATHSALVRGGARETITLPSGATLLFDWSGITLVAAPDAGGREQALRGVAVAMRLIETSLAFLAATEGLERLTSCQLEAQVEDQLHGRSAPDGVRATNRLRIFALAVAGQCDYSAVAASADYQAYLAHFERQAAIRQRLEAIKERCAVLHDVQAEETRAAEAERQGRLNRFVMALTVITVASVVADVYGYLGGGPPHPIATEGRALLLLAVLLLVILGLLSQVGRRRP